MGNPPPHNTHNYSSIIITSPPRLHLYPPSLTPPSPRPSHSLYTTTITTNTPSYSTDTTNTNTPHDHHNHSIPPRLLQTPHLTLLTQSSPTLPTTITTAHPQSSSTFRPCTPITVSTITTINPCTTTAFQTRQDFEYRCLLLGSYSDRI